MTTGPRPTIFWDFDGTLVVYAKWSEVLLKALDIVHPGHIVTRNQLLEFLHEGFPWHDYDKPHPRLSSSEAWWALVRPILAGACQGVGFGSRESDLLAKMAQEMMLRPDNYRLFDDTLPVLEGLNNRGWRHFILSNNFPELPDIIRQTPFYNLIAECITSGLVGYDKPNPGIFRYALDLAGHPERVWMVGDNIKADVRGAEAVGIPAILVRAPANEPVTYFATDLYEAAAIIEENE